MAKTETGLLLAPQLKAILNSEAYHYCADCRTHCRQTILAVEAAKEAVKAHAADAGQLVELRKVVSSACDLLMKGYASTALSQLRAAQQPEKETLE